MKCIVCGEEFQAKRKDAKCCSSTCRSVAKRATDRSVADKRKAFVEALAESGATEAMSEKQRAEFEKHSKGTVAKNEGEKKLELPSTQIEWTASDVQNRDEVTFQGRKLSELNFEDEIMIGEVRTKIKDLRWWMLDGPLNRDSLPRAKGVRMSAQEKRKTFRELMYQYDCRYGARDKDFNLIAM